MDSKFLEGLGIDDKETRTKIMAENSKNIESFKQKSQTLEAEKTTLTEKVVDYESQVKARDKQLKELNKIVGDSEEAQKRIKELEEENSNFQTTMTEKDKQYAEKLETMKFDSKLDNHLMSLNPKNLKAVKALLDKESIKLDGDKFFGLDDQITSLKESDSYLFNETADTGSGGNPSVDNKTVNTDNMSDAEFYAWEAQQRSK